MNNRIKNNNSRKSAAKREKIIMIVSSAFVMAALTMTGIYMKEKSEQERNDGYTVDLAELDTNNIEDKYQELAENVNKPSEPKQDIVPLPEDTMVADGSGLDESILDAELDYMPMEGSVIGENSVTAVGSGQIEIPGVTSEVTEVVEIEEPTSGTYQLAFSEEEGLITPVVGDILMHYNMDSTVYFQTLDQYKYNPAVIFQAQEGSNVVACSDGQVTKIYQNEEIGVALVLDLGNGYEVTYGQLASYRVGLGDYVTANQIIGTVASPTKYYVTEGPNLYFAMEKDGVAINPEEMLTK